MSEPKKPTVLLVDDNRDIQTVISISLRHFGFSVVCVGDAQQAIEAVNNHRPSIAIIDYGLPGTDGITLGQQIKQSGWGDQIKLMLFSGSFDADMKARADAAGFEDYLIKPVRMNELKKRLDQLESSHRT